MSMKPLPWKRYALGSALLFLTACSTEGGAFQNEGQILAPPTPAPAPTPDVISQEISNITYSTGLNEVYFLGFSLEEWINVGVSLVIIFLGYLLGTWLIRLLTRWLVDRTSLEFGRAVLTATGSQVRWIIVIISAHYATLRLHFLNPIVKQLLFNVYFLIEIVLLTLIVWRLMDIGYRQMRQRYEKEGRLQEMDPALVLLTRLGRIILLVISVSIFLAYIGVNVPALTAALGIGGLGLSLAARDTIADAIAGFIILFDRPFRIGDRIEIQEIQTWGDVVEIGLRTTRIRTRDNRLVIVPNSIIGTNQIVNYTYPDPRYRIQIHVSIAYGRDIETVRQLLINTTRQVTGVLPDQPVEALYVEMGDSAMIFRVRWWIESYVDTRRMFDQVNTAIQKALDEQGIAIPFPTQTLNVTLESKTVDSADES